MLKRFGKITVQLDHISLIEEHEGYIIIVLSSGKEIKVEESYSQLIDYINYLQRNGVN